jgi:tetratricopeptide (TPR) repeat protein
LVRAGAVFAQLGKINDERKALEEAVQILRETGHLADLWVPLTRLGYVDMEQGHYEEARAKCEEAKRIVSSGADRMGLATVSVALACLDRFHGSYTEARRELNESLRIRRTLGDRAAVASTYHELANLGRLQGRYAEARRGYNESLRIRRTLRDRRGVAVTLHELAELDRLQGKYAKARRGYSESLRIKRVVGDKRNAAVTEMYLAATEAKLRSALSLNRFEKALDAIRKIGDPHPLVRGYLLLAEVHRARGEHQEALKAAGTTLALSWKHGFRGLEADAQALRAVLSAGRGNYADAIQYARSAMAFFKKEGVQHPLRSQIAEMLSEQRRNSAPAVKRRARR